jgi:hypothetical protein
LEADLTGKHARTHGKTTWQQRLIAGD